MRLLHLNLLGMARTVHDVVEWYCIEVTDGRNGQDIIALCETHLTANSFGVDRCMQPQ